MFRLVFIFFLCSTLHSLELNRVILSTNNNPKYIEFWPVVAPIWKAMGFQPTLALIADEDCPIDSSLGDVIRFDPIPGVPEDLHAQAIRLLLPMLFPEDGCIISDIDMIPISPSYFFNGAEFCPDDAFLVYRDNVLGYTGFRYPMCYVAAKGKVFASLFNISDPKDIEVLILRWANYKLGWNTDELILHWYVKDWEKNEKPLLLLGHDVIGRLDRGDWNFDINSINIKDYIDCHCPRPYSAYKESIDQVVGAVMRSMND